MNRCRPTPMNPCPDERSVRPPMRTSTSSQCASDRCVASATSASAAARFSIVPSENTMPQPKVLPRGFCS